MIYLDSDTVFLWQGMRDSVTGSYVNDASVAGSLQDLDGTELQSFSFSYIDGSNGDYEGTVSAAMTTGLDPSGEYYVAITATRVGQTVTKRERHTTNYLGYK
jgi:hypothetical protein